MTTFQSILKELQYTMDSDNIQIKDIEWGRITAIHELFDTTYDFDSDLNLDLDIDLGAVSAYTGEPTEVFKGTIMLKDNSWLSLTTDCYPNEYAYIWLHHVAPTKPSDWK